LYRSPKQNKQKEMCLTTVVANFSLPCHCVLLTVRGQTASGAALITRPNPRRMLTVRGQTASGAALITRPNPHRMLPVRGLLLDGLF